mgnify:CR=1 FL=1
MSHDSTDFADEVCRQLQDDGYAVHMGNTADGPELSCKHWFTWMKPGMSDAEVGPSCDTALAAWASALAHRIANSEVELHLIEGRATRPSMGETQAKTSPEAASRR